ncbi:phage tail tape measure protein [Pseudomonas nitroreducens]|uniref:phage tail tape measure protein n=1 Tax=Pseudomonas nitroreducens TaxID=46680 RepID=UPI0014731EFE|nr:phage tail tape measure protein [Pseudomonas nitroreducens]NMZ77357.1 phage tail tape measure protein [Pseudomonas nitroreducens]
MASKSLGTLTLDLIAKIGGFTGPLDQASRKAQKSFNEIKVSAIAAGEVVGRFAGDFIAGIPGAMKQLATGTAQASKEIVNLSNVAGLNTTTFQKLAAGASTVGISQEKFADILKDVNDKVGDFLNTGGGGMQDFFTRIAPKVGVTADQFKKLNSADALQLYVSTLEKANVSQSEMTFYLEAIASDATGLLPLLKENGKEFKALGDAAEAAGAILSVQTIVVSQELSKEFIELNQNVTGFKNNLVEFFLPVLGEFTKDMNDAIGKTDGLGKAATDTSESIVKIAAFIGNVGDGIVRVFDSAANLIVGVFATGAYHLDSLGSDLFALLAKLPGDLGSDYAKKAAEYASEAKSQFAIAEEAGNKIRENLESPLIGETFEKYVKKAQEAAKAAAAAVTPNEGKTGGTGSGVDPNEQKRLEAAAKAAEAAQKKLQSQVDSTIQDYERQIALINTEVDKRKDATEVAKLQFEIESGKLVGINELQQKRLNGLAAELDRLKKLKQANEDAAKAAAFGATLDQENNTASAGLGIQLAGAGMGEKYRGRLQELLQIRQSFNEKLADLNIQYNSGEITKELYDQESEIIQAAMDKRLKIQERYYEKADEAQADWMKGVNEAFQNYIDTAEDSYQIAADAVTNILGGATDALSDSIYDVFTGTETLSDALGNLATTIGQTIVKAIADMIAQWLVAQAVQLVFGKTTQASAAAAMTANAQATALQAGLAAFASTAAIPIVGPALAPGAMAAALAVAEPLAAAVSATSLAGMAHDGIDAVPETGTWLLQKGERVTTASTSAKLDKTLSDIQNNQTDNSRSTVIHFYQQGGGSSREQQASTAKAARQIARAVDAAGRYS